MTPKNLLGYAGKRVVVSGCFSGIGNAVANILVEQGAKVHGLDYKHADKDLHAFTLIDLRDPCTIDDAANAIAEPIDALFNCAGIPPGAPPLDVMKVNFIGARHLTRRLLPRMQKGGGIANVASVGGAGWPQHVPELTQLVQTEGFETASKWCLQHEALVSEGYRLSKEAIIVWTLLESAQLIKRGIRMNCTIPGAVQTPMLMEIEKTTPSAAIDTIAQPIGRRSAPEEQAVPLLFLNSAGAGYVNGVALAVDGGFTAGSMLQR